MRIFWIIVSTIGRAIRVRGLPGRNRRRFKRRSALPQLEEPLAVFDRLAVLDQDLDDRALGFSLDLVHDLHRFDDADQRVILDLRADVHERLTLG